MDERGETTIMSAADLRRAVHRLAHDIADRTRGAQDLMLIGIRTRGVPLARRLATLIGEFESLDIAVGELDIALYRDDLTTRREVPRLHRTEIPGDVTNRTIVLVDDVLFTGRTVRSAMDALADLGRPARIQLAVLIDREQWELPIRADYVGRRISASPDEKLQVRLAEVDGEDRVAAIPARQALPPR